MSRRPSLGPRRRSFLSGGSSAEDSPKVERNRRRSTHRSNEVTTSDGFTFSKKRPAADPEPDTAAPAKRARTLTPKAAAAAGKSKSAAKTEKKKAPKLPPLKYPASSDSLAINIDPSTPNDQALAQLVKTIIQHELKSAETAWLPHYPRIHGAVAQIAAQFETELPQNEIMLYLKRLATGQSTKQHLQNPQNRSLQTQIEAKRAALATLQSRNSDWTKLAQEWKERAETKSGAINAGVDSCTDEERDLLSKSNLTSELEALVHGSSVLLEELSRATVGISSTVDAAEAAQKSVAAQVNQERALRSGPPRDPRQLIGSMLAGAASASSSHSS